MESYFQTDSWGEFKAKTGWRFQRLGEALRLSRAIGLGRILYYYPEIPFDIALIQRLQTAATNKRAIFTRFDFLAEYDEQKAEQLKGLGLIRSFEEIQPEYRQWVDVARSEADILAAMKPKGRYNIGVAERHGLEVIRGGKDLVPDFYKLYTYTATRTKFHGRAQSYFALLSEALSDNNVGEIVLIKKGDELLSGGIFLYYQDMASYLYGGSMGDRALMAPYLLHWTAILEAKKRGCKIYDLLAIAPVKENGETDESHAYAGLTRFKTQFGGRSVRMLGAWDLIHSHFWYKMYQLAERRRRPKNTQ